MMFQRHDMVYITPWGREAAIGFTEAAYPGLDRAAAAELIRNERIPGIVRRQETPREDMLEVGFAAHYYHEGRRFRVSSCIPVAGITKKITPFQILENIVDFHDVPKQRPLSKIIAAAKDEKIAVGLYGSTALHILTGLPYHRADSDLDLYIKRRGDMSGPGLWRFFKRVCDIERAYAVKTDIEVEARGCYGVKLKELFSGQKTVMGKGYTDAGLFYVSQMKEFGEDIRAFENSLKGRD